MEEFYRRQLEGMRDAANHMVADDRSLIDANQSITAAAQKITEATEAALMAKDEREDLRVTIDRLEKLVMEQGDKIKTLLDRNPPPTEH